MARVLSEYEFKTHRHSIYPWQKWADGQIWQVFKGKDYKSENGFRSSALGYARRNGLTLQTSITKVQGKQAIVFQFAKANTKAAAKRTAKPAAKRTTKAVVKKTTQRRK